MPHTPAPSPARVAARVAKKWKKLPKGWTEESVKKFWKTLTDRAPKHPVSRCIREMDGKVDDPGGFCGGLADQMIPGWREEAAKERREKKASMQRYCGYWLASNGEWYVDLADREYGDYEDAFTYGPFRSEAEARKYVRDNHSNPGGSWTDDSGEKPAPRESPNGYPVQSPRQVWRRWACGDGPCQCGGSCGCKGGSPLSMQPDYGTSDAALPRGASAARVAALYGGLTEDVSG